MKPVNSRIRTSPLGFAILACISGLALAEASQKREKTKQPTAEAKAWALASDALLPTSNGAALDKLEYRFPSEAGADTKQHLADWWGVTSREELLNMLKWLEDEGHRARFGQIAAALAAPKEQANADFLAELGKAQDGRCERTVVEKYGEKLGMTPRAHGSRFRGARSSTKRPGRGPGRLPWRGEASAWRPRRATERPPRGWRVPPRRASGRRASCRSARGRESLPSA